MVDNTIQVCIRGTGYSAGECPQVVSRFVTQRIKGVACMQDVGCAHPGFASCLACIRCPKVRCVHLSKWPQAFWLRVSVHKKTLRASVSEMTLAYIRF